MNEILQPWQLLLAILSGWIQDRACFPDRGAPVGRGLQGGSGLDAGQNIVIQHLVPHELRSPTLATAVCRFLRLGTDVRRAAKSVGQTPTGSSNCAVPACRLMTLRFGWRKKGFGIVAPRSFAPTPRVRFIACTGRS